MVRKASCAQCNAPFRGDLDRHNGQPVVDGQVCTLCNVTHVIPVRMQHVRLPQIGEELPQLTEEEEAAVIALMAQAAEADVELRSRPDLLSMSGVPKEHLDVIELRRAGAS
jgi:hypothetical protein